MDSRGVNISRGVIMGVLLLVLLGHLFLWVIYPTNLFKQKWVPKIRADTSSTYFGIQGTTILLFTFPVLFIAVLGSLYLHLGKNYNSLNFSSNGKNHEKSAIWKRPMIIKGLGIVTRTELAFFVMFISLLVWSFSTYLRVSLAKITPQSAAEHGEKL